MTGSSREGSQDQEKQKVVPWEEYQRVCQNLSMVSSAYFLRGKLGIKESRKHALNTLRGRNSKRTMSQYKLYIRQALNSILVRAREEFSDAGLTAENIYEFVTTDNPRYQMGHPEEVWYSPVILYSGWWNSVVQFTSLPLDKVQCRGNDLSEWLRIQIEDDDEGLIDYCPKITEAKAIVSFGHDVIEALKQWISWNFPQEPGHPYNFALGS